MTERVCDFTSEGEKPSICFSSRGVHRREFISSGKKNIPVASVVAVQTAG